MTTHCYHTTPAGHKVHLTVEGTGAPVLLSFHGGGLCMGSRSDDYIPAPIKDGWPGTQIAADYRLLLPSSGHDVLADVTALLAFLLTLPIAHDQLVLLGVSGGGYPARLAALLAAREAQRAAPRFAVRACALYAGMAGDLLRDGAWLAPRGTSFQPLDTDNLAAAQAALRAAVAPMFAEPEISEGAFEARPDRVAVWAYWHGTATLADAVAGEAGLSARLAALPYGARAAAIPAQHRAVFPQLGLAEPALAAHLPPFLLVHGDQDEGVPYAESVHTVEAVQAAGGRAELVTVHGGDHTLLVDGELPQAATDAYAYTLEWMLKHVKG